MRVAVWHNLPSGGGKRALHDHVKGLLKRGHEVESWRPPADDDGFLPLGEMIPEHVVDLEWPVAPRRSDEWQVTLRTERAIRSMDRHCRLCAEQIARGRFDILFANSCRHFRTTSIGRQSRLPSVLYLQEPFRWLYEALPRLPWLARAAGPSGRGAVGQARAAFADLRDIRNLRVQAREEVDNAAAFDRILVNSRFSRESVLRAYGIDSTVCYLGIDTDVFVDLGLAREDFVLGLGSVVPEKNPELCIAAIGAVDPPRPKLVWIGNIGGPRYENELAELARARGVDLELRVGASHAEVVDLLNRAAMMIYAPRLEPFGLAPLEANACGAPVVAVAEGGVRETIVHEQNGLLADADPAAMAAAIIRLRRDPALARRLGQTGRDHVRERWSIDAANDRLERALLRHAAS